MLPFTANHINSATYFYNLLRNLLILSLPLQSRQHNVFLGYQQLCSRIHRAKPILLLPKVVFVFGFCFFLLFYFSSKLFSKLGKKNGAKCRTSKWISAFGFQCMQVMKFGLGLQDYILSFHFLVSLCPIVISDFVLAFQVLWGQGGPLLLGL